MEQVKIETKINPITGDSLEVKLYDPRCIIGYPLPEFIANTIHSDTISDKSLLGKVSILNFWFIDCPPCRAEIPGLNDIKKKFGDKRVNYIAIANDDKKDLLDFINKNPFDYNHIYNGKSIYQDSFESKWGYPLTILANKEGIIIDVIGGGRTDSLASIEIFGRLEPTIRKEIQTIKR